GIRDFHVTGVQTCTLPISLHAKGETADELKTMAQVMRESTVPVGADGPVLDTTGTGGDEKRSINISTLGAIVAAAAGARVVKQRSEERRVGKEWRTRLTRW